MVLVKKIIEKGQSVITARQSSILSAASIITVSNLASALLGLLRNRLLVGRFFGTDALESQLDAFWVAFRVPELLFQLLVIGALSAAFIPIYTKYKNKSEADARVITNSVMNIVLLAFVLISIIIYFFAEQLNGYITAEGFTVEQIQIAANLSRIMLLAQLSFAVSNFLTGIIQANKNFLVPALAPLAYNAGIILGIIFLTPTMGIYGAAWGVVIGGFLHLIIQLPMAIKLGFRYLPVIKWHKGVKEMITLMPPRIMSIGVNQIAIFANVYFATALSAGSLTLFNIAQQLMSAPIRIFSVPIGQASLPFLSQKFNEGKLKAFTNTLVGSLHQILFIALPAGTLLLILRIPLVRLAYGTPDFPWADTLLTGKVVGLLAISLFAQSGLHIVVRAFYALHDTKTPFTVGLSTVILNIVLSYIAIYTLDMGIIGLAAAMSIAASVQFFVLLSILLSKLPVKDTLALYLPIIKMLIASAIMGVSLWIPFRYLDRNFFDTTFVMPLIGLTLVVSSIGLGVYFGLAYLFKIEQLAIYRQFLVYLGNWKKVLGSLTEMIKPSSHSDDIGPL